MTNKLVGLSLSFCVVDILRGDIAESDVLYLITSTMCSDECSWKEVLNSYKQLYWRKNPEFAEQIAMRFWNNGKILQPRTGQLLGNLEGKIPLMNGRVVASGEFGAKWIDPETFQAVHL